MIRDIERQMDEDVSRVLQCIDYAAIEQRILDQVGPNHPPPVSQETITGRALWYAPGRTSRFGLSPQLAMMVCSPSKTRWEHLEEDDADI